MLIRFDTARYVLKIFRPSTLCLRYVQPVCSLPPIYLNVFYASATPVIYFIALTLYDIARTVSMLSWVIVGCRWNRPINLTKHRAAWHLNTRLSISSCSAIGHHMCGMLKRLSLQLTSAIYSSVFRYIFYTFKIIINFMEQSCRMRNEDAIDERKIPMKVKFKSCDTLIVFVVRFGTAHVIKG